MMAIVNNILPLHMSNQQLFKYEIFFSLYHCIPSHLFQLNNLLLLPRHLCLYCFFGLFLPKAAATSAKRRRYHWPSDDRLKTLHKFERTSDQDVRSQRYKLICMPTLALVLNQSFGLKCTLPRWHLSMSQIRLSFKAAIDHYLNQEPMISDLTKPLETQTQRLRCVHCLQQIMANKPI